MKASNVIAIVLFILALGLGFLGGKLVYQQEIVEKTITTVDTVFVDKPVPVYETKVETKYYKVVETDTVYNESVRIVYKDGTPNVVLNRTQKYYNKPGLYEAWVSGVEPSLDSCNVFKTTTTTEFVKKPKNSLIAFINADYFPMTSNALSFSAGLEWEHTSGFSLRGGYLCGFKPNVENSNFNGLFVGAGYKFPIIKR